MAKKLSHLIVPILVIILLFVWSEVFKGNDRGMKVYFFDVGQGDAALIETPTGEQILIDGGPDSLILSRLGQVLPFYDRTLDLVILTHPHADHVTGLVDVLQKYKIKEVWLTGVIHTSPEYLAFLELVREKEIPTEISQSGQEEIFGEAKLTTLYPFLGLEGQKVENLNNTSIVNRLEYKGTRILFTGDIEVEAEKEMLGQRTDLRADYLKQPHHGSELFLADFLKAVSPKTSIVSVGRKNKFNHPSKETLKILEKEGIRIQRTDQEKTILLSFD